MKSNPAHRTSRLSNFVNQLSNQEQNVEDSLVSSISRATFADNTIAATTAAASFAFAAQGNAQMISDANTKRIADLAQILTSSDIASFMMEADALQQVASMINTTFTNYSQTYSAKMDRVHVTTADEASIAQLATAQLSTADGIVFEVRAQSTRLAALDSSVTLVLASASDHFSHDPSTAVAVAAQASIAASTIAAAQRAVDPLFTSSVLCSSLVADLSDRLDAQESLSEELSVAIASQTSNILQQQQRLANLDNLLAEVEIALQQLPSC